MIIKIKKLPLVFHASLLLLAMNFVHHNINFDNVMTKFIINNNTDARKTDVNLFFTITNYQIVYS